MNAQDQIGKFIQALRKRRGFSEEEFALKINISKDELIEIESGQKPISTEQIDEMSHILGHSIVSLADSTDLSIRGGKKLSGSITVNGSKNGAMGLMCGALLNKSSTILHNIPRIEEVNRIMETLHSIGVDVHWIDQNSLKITPPEEFDLSDLNTDSSGKTRTIIMFVGPLIHHLKNFKLPHSKGCLLGKRTVSAHLYGLEELGVKVEVEHDHYDIDSSELHPGHITMYESGDTAVENLLLASALIPGKTKITFASANYMVQDVCFFLESAGVKVEGIGTSTLIVHGVEEINKELEVYNSQDPIEAMMFLTAGIVTDSEITIKKTPADFLELELYKLKLMGLKFDKSEIYVSENGRTRLTDVTIYPSKLTAPDDKLYGRPYPGINIDNLPFFVPIAAHAEGKTLIHDWVFENRAIYFMELNKLGAQMILADPHRVFVEGKTQWKPAQVVCPPALRPAMIILLGMLAAPGTSVLRNIYSIARGYEEVAERLNSLGADIQIISDNR